MSQLLANMPIAACTDEACFSVSKEELYRRSIAGDESAKVELARRRYNDRMKAYYRAAYKATQEGTEPPPEPPPFRGVEEFEASWGERAPRKPADLQGRPAAAPPPPAAPVSPDALYIDVVMKGSFGTIYGIFSAPGKFDPHTSGKDRAVVEGHLARMKTKTNRGRRR